MDVDTPEDYKRLYACAQHAQTPFEEVCAAIWNWAGTPEQVREHCRMVAQTAGMLAQRLNAVGHPVEVALVRSGALLHDVAKAYPRHIERGARMLRVLGYPKVAAVMETHNDLPAASQCALDARALVFLADKLVSGAEVVGLDVRFARTFQKYAENPAAAENIRRRKRIAQEVAERVADRLGVGNIDEILKGM
jgi:putative nucleotidyltransferase with HDIG domain